MSKRKRKAFKFTSFLAAAVMSLTILSGCTESAPGSGANEDADSAVSLSEDTRNAESEISETAKVFETDGSPEITETAPPPPAELPEGAVTSVTADETKGDYIAPKTSFTLLSKDDFAAEELSAIIKLSPDIPFELERTRECTYVMRLASPVPDNSILRLSLESGRSWAFQTADIFRVTGVFPANEAEYVPTNSGIEMTFSEPVDLNSVRENFTVSPAAEGRFEQHNNGKTLVFVPTEWFRDNTVYSVTISENIKCESGDILGEEYFFRFKTQKGSGSDYCYPSKGISETFLPGDTVLTEVYASDSVEKGTFDVKLYKYPSADEYIAQMKEAAAGTKSPFFEEEGIVIPPSENAELIYSETLSLQSKTSGYSWLPSYLMLPDDLEEGYYLLNARTEKDKLPIDRFIQISDISVYASILPGSTAFFVNDASSGKPAEGAQIDIYDSGREYACTADDNGTATVQAENTDRGQAVFTVKYKGRTYADFLPLRNGWDRELKDDYITYMYTDREMYRTSDTVKVWGTLFPRYKDISLPRDINLFMGYYGNDGESVPVTLKKDGTFTAEVPVNSAKDGWYSLSLRSGDEVLYSKYLDIEDYVKPSYLLEAYGEEVVFMAADNPFEVTLEASYFEGTPAAALEFDVRGAKEETASTDENGHLSVTAAPKDEEESNPIPRYRSVEFTMAGKEDEYQTAWFYYIDVHRDVYADIEQEGERVGVWANLIDPDKVTEDNIYNYEEYIAGPAEVEVTLTLEKGWTEKHEKGTYYDFLQKKTYTKYDYTYHSEDVGTFTAKTVNGKGVFEGIEFDDKSSYHGSITWRDTHGKKCYRNVWLDNPNSSKKIYNRSDGSYKRYSISPSDFFFKENETVHFDLYCLTSDDGYSYRNVPVTAAEGDRIFYTVNRDDFLEVGTAKGVSFDYKTTRDCIPNIRVSAAYFDGRHIYPVSNYFYDYNGSYYFNGELQFDWSERELDVTVLSDKQSYAPGDEVKITVKAADINGKPAAGASVSLSVVDEAAFAAAPQNPDPLGALYMSTDIPWPKDYYSYNQYSLNMNGGGEMGGGGDDYAARRDFKDTAAFLTAAADSTGKAEFTFKVPDNVTSWRATAHAVSNRPEGVWAGVSKEPVIATLPFFITPAVSDVFIEGDDVSFAAKTTAGNADITFNLKGNGVDETVTVPEISSAKFGKLKKGDYTVTLSAKSGEYTDAVELPVSVVDTILETSVVREFDLTKDKFEISPLRYPVKLLFYDSEYTVYAGALCKLSSLYGDRADYQLARAFAAKEFGYITEEEYLKSLNSFKQNRFISLWRYSEGDPHLTAVIAAAESEATAGAATAAAFREILTDEQSTPEEVSNAYLGLAALGEPVLAEVTRVLRENDKFSDTDMLRFGAAYGIMGDTDKGVEIFDKISRKIMSGYTTKDNTPALKTDSEYNDLAALMAASALNLDHAELLAQHVILQKQREESCAAYLMFYQKNYTPKTREKKTPAAVEITANGKTEEIEIDALFGKFVTLNKSQTEAEDFAVTLKNGSVKCLAYYEGRITDNQKPQTLKVTKTIKSVNGSFAPGALLQVTVNVSGFPDPDYQYAAVDDVIPSGARFVKSGPNSYVNRRDMRVSGSVSYGNSYRPMIYFIRLVTPGEYVVESAAARQGNDLWGCSERSTLTIEESGGNA